MMMYPDGSLPVLCPKCGKEIITPIREDATFPNRTMVFDSENNDEIIIKDDNKIIKCDCCD